MALNKETVYDLIQTKDRKEKEKKIISIVDGTLTDMVRT